MMDKRNRFDESTPDGQAAIKMREGMRQRFAVEVAIDHVLRSSAARVIALNSYATEELFVNRCRLAFRAVKAELIKFEKGAKQR